MAWKIKKNRLNVRTLNARASCAGGLEIKSRSGQILNSVANHLPPLPTSTQAAVLP